MNTIIYVRPLAAYGVALSLFVGMTEDVSGQSDVAFEAALESVVGGEPVRRGTALVTLDGDQLRVLGSFSGLTSPWVQADIYNGDPDDGGEHVVNLVIRLHDPSALGGGFDQTVTLTEQQVERLGQGELFVLITSESSSPDAKLKGRIQASAFAEDTSMETPLSQFYMGQPVSRGSIRAIGSETTFRFVGFFNALASNWQQIRITKGLPGDEAEPVVTLLSIFDGGVYGGFDHTFEMPEGWQSDFANGLYGVEIMTSRSEDGLTGRLLPASNQAPPASVVLSPIQGETILVGGTHGAPATDPATPLTNVTFSTVEDPDGQSVEYFLQVSNRSDFSGLKPARTYDLGVGGVVMPLTAATAAEIFDGFFGGGTPMPLDTPKTLYFRSVTTDGSRYSVSDAVDVTFVRGLISANESGVEMPDGLRLRGNYPNPFNPSTTVAFDLDVTADIRLEVFDAAGRQVLNIDGGRRSAGADHHIAVDASGLPSGGYLYRLVATSYNEARVVTGRMTLLK